MYGEEEKRDNKKIDLKSQKYSEPIPPTQREMHPSLTKRDVLRQCEKKVCEMNEMKVPKS